MRAIELCRTAALGGHVEVCSDCGLVRHRLQFLPQPPLPEVPGPGPRRVARSPPGRAAAGAVFPRRVHPAGRRSPRSPSRTRQTVYAILFRAAAETLRSIAADPQASRRRDRPRRRAPHLGSEPASPPARPLRRARRRPVARRHALGRLPARLLPAGARALASLPAAVPRALRGVFEAGGLGFFGDLAALADPDAFARLLRELRQIEWVVYAKPPFGGPAQVLAYLGRYTHRVAITNHRLVSVTDARGRLPLEGLSPPRQGQGHDPRRPTSSSAGSCCTPCRTASTASATTASSPTVIAPRSWRSAVRCSRLAPSNPPCGKPTMRPSSRPLDRCPCCGGIMIILGTQPPRRTMRPILLVGQLMTSRQSDSIDPAIPSAEPARTDRCVCRRRVTPAPGKSGDKTASTLRRRAGSGTHNRHRRPASSSPDIPPALANPGLAPTGQAAIPIAQPPTPRVRSIRLQ